jgi:hypothetical protein
MAKLLYAINTLMADKLRQKLNVNKKVCHSRMAAN